MYQLRWDDGVRKEDLVHQDRLKLTKAPDDATQRRAWFSKTRHAMESARDNEDDGLPDESLDNNSSTCITDMRAQQRANEDYHARRGSHYQAPMMGSAEHAARV
ncbi:hypothetical protein KI688_008774 [Linnemannia hyalina]|uniref:Uncharacterized protein n=1 Tax=Linnemannia hyalina TaxID=64524 RepID=A0A9P8BW63_9FUNG|nr:hypothetical protein KI688_008774 [Linnemannia hyalina]